MKPMKVGDKVLAQEVLSKQWVPGVITELGTQPGMYWVQNEGYQRPVPRDKGTVKPFTRPGDNIPG